MTLPRCVRCRERFAYRHVELYLHQQTGAALPVACALCRFLGPSHTHEVGNATAPRHPTARSRQTLGHQVASSPAPPATPRPRRPRQFPALLPLATMVAQVGAWAQCHGGALPMARDFLHDKTLPTHATLIRRFASLAGFYATLDIYRPGSAAQYAQQRLDRCRLRPGSGLTRAQLTRRLYIVRKQQGLCVECGQPAAVEGDRTLTRCAPCRTLLKRRTCQADTVQEAM